MLSTTIVIDQKVIGKDAKPYVIAEAGSNFNQSLETAKDLITAASAAGADAVKFQLFRAEFLYPKRDGLYQVFKDIELKPEWIPELSKFAREAGVTFLASAFDSLSVEVLESVDVGAHKIASSELTNFPLLQLIASTGKPVLLSTGMSDLIDIDEAVNLCLATGNPNIVLLQCGSMYPLPSQHTHLRVIQTLKTLYGCPIGFSDHTLDSVAATTAVGLGSVLFEKHFTLNREMPGPDHFYALEPKELSSYVKSISKAHDSLGSEKKEMLEDERANGRRDGIYAARMISAGEKITDSDLVIRRPAVGLRSRYFEFVLGATAVRTIAPDAPIIWDDIRLSES